MDKNYFGLVMADQYGIRARITDAVRAKNVIQLRHLLSEYKRTSLDNTLGELWPHDIMLLVGCSKLQSMAYPANDEEVTSIAEEFLRVGADANARDTITWNTVLMCAVQKRNISLCQLLLQYGADVNAKLHTKSMISSPSALCLAAEQDECCDIAALLRDHGGIVKGQSMGKYTFVSFIAQSETTDVGVYP